MPDYIYRIGQTGADEVRRQIKEIGGEGEATAARLVSSAERRFGQEQALERQLEAVRKGREETEARVLALIGGPEAMAAWEAQRRGLARTAAGMQEVSVQSNGVRAGLLNITFQAQDFLVQWTSGAGAMRAFAQQAPQMIGALQQMALSAGESGGRLAQLGALLQGPLGIGLGIATPLIGLFANSLAESGKAAEEAEKATASFARNLLNVDQFADKATGRMLHLADATLRAAKAMNLVRQNEINGQAISLQDRGFQAAIRFNREQGTATRPGGPMGTPGFHQQVRYDPDVSEAIAKAGGVHGNLIVLERGIAEAAKRRPELRGLATELSNLAAQSIDAAKSARTLRDDFDFLTGARPILPGFTPPAVKGGGGGGDGGGGSRPSAVKPSFAVPGYDDLVAGVRADYEKQLEHYLAPLRDKPFDLDKVIQGWDEVAQSQGRAIEGSEEWRRQVDLLADSMDEARRFGEQMVDTLFDPRNWDDWGELGKRVLKEIEAEMIQLAILNPLKNALFGDSQPTFSSVGGSFGKLLGGGGGSGLVAGDGGWFGKLLGGVFHFASGTEYAPGGMAVLGEHGAEAAFLPRGSRVVPASETRRMMAGRGGVTVTIYNQYDATGADAEALSRVQLQQREMEARLPATIVQTVNEALERGYISA